MEKILKKIKYLQSLYLSRRYDPLSVANLTLLYINSGAVIPAKAGIQPKNTGFRVKPEMTNKAKTFLNHYITC